MEAQLPIPLTKSTAEITEPVFLVKSKKLGRDVFFALSPKPNVRYFYIADFRIFTS
ncbi:MAG: hypothetical protein ACJ0NN_00055 [Thermodesulfobacteriota bacterium]